MAGEPVLGVPGGEKEDEWMDADIGGMLDAMNQDQDTAIAELESTVDDLVEQVIDLKARQEVIREGLLEVVKALKQVSGRCLVDGAGFQIDLGVEEEVLARLMELMAGEVGH